MLTGIFMLSDIVIILNEPSHPGNIGAVARAMKNMGLSRLVLVSPKDYPSVQATARASGADEILEAATVVDSLDAAIAGLRLVIGASARSRRLPWPLLDPRECAAKALEHWQQGDVPVGVVFGRESSGLSNSELERCRYLVNIPANPEYSSLNLAASVQVICYELRMAFLAAESLTDARGGSARTDSALATADAVARFYQHLEQVLTSIGFVRAQQPVSMMRRLKRLFNRCQLEKKEVQILRGILTAIEKNSKSR